MRLCLPIAAMLLAASPAQADITAVYKAKAFPVSMSVEIADSGSVRYQMSMGSTYGIVRDGVDYAVSMTPAGAVVDRFNDLAAVQGELMAQFMPKDHFKDALTQNELRLVEIGPVTVNGRKGIAYSMQEGTKPSKNAHPFMVSSTDPALQPLGRVMATQFGKSTAMMGSMIGSVPTEFLAVTQTLGKGAPLSFAGMDLDTVATAPIDPKRFDLPAAPQTIDQIRARLKPLPAPPTAAPEKP